MPNVNRDTTYIVMNYLTAKIVDDDYSAEVHSESMLTAHDEHAFDAFAIGSHPHRETNISNIVSYCAPLERVLQASRRALLCTHTRSMQRASCEYLNVALDTNYQLRSMNSISRCTLI